MKIAAIFLALVLTLTTTSSCGESTEVQYDEPKVAVEEVTIPEPEPEPKPDPSKYDGITNIFVSPLEDIDIDLRSEDVNIYQYNASWDDETNQYALRTYVFRNDEMYYGVIANEDLSRSAVAWIDIRNPDRTEFNKLLNTLDWHPEEYPYGESDIPYGYISTEDSAIIVNGTFYYEQYNTEEEMYELWNINSLAYVMGVDIQSAISSRNSIDLLWDIVTTLNEANYLGTRGYDEYLDYNPYGIICDDFEEIQYSINNPYSGIYAAIYDDVYYVEETPIEPSTTPSKKYPPIVNQYIDYGYEVYEFNYCGAVGYYYRSGWAEYILFCAGNGDMVVDAYSKSVLQPVMGDSMFMTRLS